MPDIQTEHEHRDGDYVLIRCVTIEDAAGREFAHAFEAPREAADDPDAYPYEGAGDPPASAVDALAEYLSDDAGAA